MKKSVALLREQWRDLCRDATISRTKGMGVLSPADLRDDDFEAIAAGRRDPENREFLEQLPLTVARFKRDIQKDMMIYAKNPHARERRASQDVVDTNLDITEDRYRRLYQKDIGRIHRVLFGDELTDRLLLAELRIRQEARTRHLHQDQDGIGYNAVYIARVGAAEILCVSGKDQMVAAAATKKLIAEAMSDNPDFRECADWMERRVTAEKARQELCARRILKPLPLGDVVLLRSGREQNVGTLHCSSPLPPDTFSAFFRAVGNIPEGNFRHRSVAHKNMFERLLRKLGR